MRKFILLGILLATGQITYSQTDLLINTQNRIAQNLNGDWHYIIDPYENGYYHYRYEAFDTMDNPPRAAYILNAKPTLIGRLPGISLLRDAQNARSSG